MSRAHTFRSMLLVVFLLMLAGCGGSIDQATEPSLDHSRHEVPTSAVGSPTSITVYCGSVTGCWVNWTGNETWDDAIIYRSTTDNFATATEIGREWAGVFFVDDDVEAGTRYYYWVVFQDDYGRRSSVSTSASGCVDSCASSGGPWADDRTPAPEPENGPDNLPARNLTTIAGQAPAFYTGSLLFVGVDQGREVVGDIDRTGRIISRRGEFDVRYARLNRRPGEASAADLLDDYLEESARLELVSSGRPSVMRFDVPPVVSFGGSALTSTDIELLTIAVQLVNTALPLEWRIQMPSMTPSPEPDRNERDGTIYVEFASRSRVAALHGPRTLGVAGGERFSDGTVAFGTIMMSESYRDYGDRDAVVVLAHELIHTLGLGHVERQPSIMASVIDRFPRNIPRSLLYSIDRQALRALYGRMQPGDPTTDFGYWSDASTHLFGDGLHVAFGVSWRNGYGEPWAFGGAPLTDLADNPRLRGSASWEGALLGFTPEVAPVAGDALLLIHLDSLLGSAHFTNLESWDTGRTPGAAGSGELWGDGDLGYLIAVHGNTFMQTGGDDGYLTGAFFGESHEGMGGTLEREDLTAAFGGTR